MAHSYIPPFEFPNNVFSTICCFNEKSFIAIKRDKSVVYALKKSSLA